MSSTELTPEADLKSAGAFVGHLLTLYLFAQDDVIITNAVYEGDCLFILFSIDVGDEEVDIDEPDLCGELRKHVADEGCLVPLVVSYHGDTISLASASKEIHPLLQQTALWRALWEIAESTGAKVALTALEMDGAWQWDPREIAEEQNTIPLHTAQPQGGCTKNDSSTTNSFPIEGEVKSECATNMPASFISTPSRAVHLCAAPEAA